MDLLKSPLFIVLYKMFLFFIVLFFAVILVKYIGKYAEKRKTK